MPSPGSTYCVKNGEGFSPFDPDWERLYFEAMMDIARSQGGKCPEHLKDAMARYDQVAAIRGIIVSSASLDGDHG